MNICFLLGGFTGNGGIGRVTSILANSLSEDDNYAIHTLSYYNNNKENLYIINSKVKQDFLFDSPISMTKGLLKGGIFKLQKYLKDNDIDVLIACGALYYPIAVLSCATTKTKCICWEHSNVQNASDHSFQQICRWIGAKKSDLVVTLTKYDKISYIEKYGISKIQQIYNPIDEQAFKHVRPYRSDSKKILSIGRLSYQKNFELLIDIAKEVLEANPGWTWDIYGEGELREELQRKINEYGLGKRVILKGQVNNIYELYNEYSMLVMTSRYEGFPMTLLEGMANGLPLISFDILTGPNEIIEHSINGYLIKPFNQEKMISSIKTLINNSQYRVEMSNQNLGICRNYKLDEIIKIWKKKLMNMS